MCDVPLVVLYTRGTCLPGQSTTSSLQLRRCLASRTTPGRHTSCSPVLVPVIWFRVVCSAYVCFVRVWFILGWGTLPTASRVNCFKLCNRYHGVHCVFVIMS